MKRIACSGIGTALLLGLLVLPADAQNQAQQNSQNASSSSAAGPSLGDYARQIRKNPGGTSSPKVFDNDNLPRQEKLSIIGPAPAESTATATEVKSAESAPAEGEAKASNEVRTASETKPVTTQKEAAGTSEEEEAQRKAAAKQWGDKLDAQKQQISLLTRELDVLQREYQLRAAAMYADAGNRMRNSVDWDKQDAQYKQQIADKQKTLDEAKQKLDDMQEEARKAGVSSSVLEP